MIAVYACHFPWQKIKNEAPGQKIYNAFGTYMVRRGLRNNILVTCIVEMFHPKRNDKNTCRTSFL